MIREALDRIVEIARANIFRIEDCEYSDKKLFQIIPPSPSPIALRTLTGVRDFVGRSKEFFSEKDGSGFAHIETFNKVSIVSNLLSPWQNRWIFATAEFKTESFPYGQFLDPETFIIKIQSMFIQDAMTAKLLAVAGNIKDERIANFGDDGVTQQVTVRAGIARVEHVTVPNPVTLTPYRTFLDAKQPASQFVFRMRSGGSEKQVGCALFEADGGRWKDLAMANVQWWLEENVPGLSIIA